MFECHQLSINSQGQAELMLADKGAWHQLGTIVHGAANTAQAMEIACPWEAVKLALFAHAPCSSRPHSYMQELWGSEFHKSDMAGIFRSDTGVQIGTVGHGYQVIQPAQQFAFVDALMEGTGYHYETAGALRGGSVVFLCARVGQIDVLGSGDVTRTYLAFVNSFDGSKAAQVFLTGTRMVCNNTVQVALGNAQHVLRFKHTKHVHQRLAAARSLVEHVEQTQASLAQKLETLAQRPLKARETYTAILDKLFPGDSTRTKNTKALVSDIYQDNDGNVYPDFKGTAYNLYNAITNYVDHHRPTRAEDKINGRFESALLGSGADLKQQAMDVILQLTDGTEMSARQYYGGSAVASDQEVGAGLLNSILG